MLWLLAFVGVLATPQHSSLAADLPVPPSSRASGTDGTTTRPTDTSARGMMQQTVADLIAILGDASLEKSQKKDRVSALTRRHVDYQTLGRLTLGGSWRDLTEGQRSEFIRQFTDHLLSIYLPVVTDYAGQQATVGEDRAEQGGDHTVITTVTDRKGPGGSVRQVATVACRLRHGDEGWKVIDLSIEGISVAIVFRAQFQPVVLSSGIDVLIERLRQKNAQVNREDARDNK